MGGCGSRNRKANEKGIAESTSAEVVRPPPGLTLQKPTASSTLRHDAQPFVPPQREDIDLVAKEPWERFLDQKQVFLRDKSREQFRRGKDGSYTNEYRSMLVQPWKRDTQAKTRQNFDLVKSWRESMPKPAEEEPKEEKKKKRKSTPLKKAIMAQRALAPPSEAWAKFDAHLQKFNQEKVAPEPPALLLDDMDGLGRDLVPFGLSDRCYYSDHEDPRKTHRHSSALPVPVREYVTQPITPELETSVTQVLFDLRQMKKQEKALGLPGRRYAVGFREVARLVANRKLLCLLVAPDVERTSGGALENAIEKVVADCYATGIPVVFALSRRQLGQAIQKNVAISVFAFQDVRGAKESFNHMLALSGNKTSEL